MPTRVVPACRTGRILWLAPLLFLALCACQAESRSRVIVLALDGVDPDAVDLLVAEGELPNFARLRRQGAYGRLRSSRPILSPIIWTTIATGRKPVDHGIGHFVAVNDKTGEQLPVTSQMRAVKAIWNIFSQAERTVGVVGWWATWPAEAVRGAMVSDHVAYHFLFDEARRAADEEVGVTYPPELYERIAPLVRRPADISHDELHRFVDVGEEDVRRPFSFADDLSHFKWALAAAETNRAIGRYLWAAHAPDLLMVYIEGTDSVAHLFGHLFRADALAGELAEQQRRYGRAVEEMYAWADTVVGEYLAMTDADTTLLVLSDHGFQLGVLPDDPSVTRDMRRRVSEKYHSLEGILYAYGAHVRAGAEFKAPQLLDIAPTILALAGLAPARDMPGRVLDEGLSSRRGTRRRASYEATAPRPGGRATAAVDPAILERLRALGYLDAESPTGDRNLAAILFQEGRYTEAADAYAGLVADQPEDGSLRASYAGALGALGRYGEALAQLDRATQLAPLNPEGYHNRGVIRERMGEVEAAVTEYRLALRYAPDYVASRQALARLGVEPDAPASEAERRAIELAGEASRLARRGDYAAAMAALDEAEKLAAHLAMLYQYRANVAFLMGDQEAARRALREALAIEPDNALFRNNLEQLDRDR